MKFCINCGKQIKEDAKFCPFCGAAQPDFELPKTDVIGEDPVTAVQSDGNVGESETRQLDNGENVAANFTDQTPDTTATQAEPKVAQPTQNKMNNDQAPSQGLGQGPVPPQPSNQSNQSNPQNQPTVGAKLDEFAQNEKVQDMKRNSLNYFSFLNHNITKPQLGVEQKAGLMGLISFILIAIFNGLAFSRVIAKGVTTMYGMMGNNGGPVFVYFIEFILMIAAILFVYVVAYFALARGFYKQNISLADAFTAIYAPASLAVYTSAATFLLSFFVESSSLIFGLLILISFLLLGYSFNGNLWTAVNRGGTSNRFYLTIGVTFATAVMVFIVSLIFLTFLASRVDIRSIIESFNFLNNGYGY